MRVLLVSDDSDFFEYIIPKLLLRKSDEIFRFSFDKSSEKLDLFKASLIVINSENSEDKTLKLLELVKDLPSIVFTYNENPDFMLKGYKAGMNEYLSILISDEELQAKMFPLLNNVGMLEKNSLYRDMLTKNKLILQNSDIYTDYNAILESELEKINLTSKPSVLVAISIQEKGKGKGDLRPEEFEKALLKNLRKTDILMKYAINRYFLLMNNIDAESAKKILQKIEEKLSEKFCYGLTNVLSKKRQQAVDEVLNRLHEAIKYDKDFARKEKNPIKELGSSKENFKVFKQEFHKKIDKIVTPVFYHVQLKYNNQINNSVIELLSDEESRSFRIRNRFFTSTFKITFPGYSKINIDIYTQHSSGKSTDKRRITFDIDEFEFGILGDLLEKFITDLKKEIENGNT